VIIYFLKCPAPFETTVVAIPQEAVAP